MVFYCESDIKKAKKNMTLCIVIDALFWLGFIAIFVPFAFFVNDGNILLFKIISSIAFISATWATIFIFSSLFPSYSSKKKILESSFYFEPKKLNAKVISVGENRTIFKGFRGKEIEVEADDSRKILILSEESSFSSLKEEETFSFVVRDTLIVEAEE